MSKYKSLWSRPPFVCTYTHTHVDHIPHCGRVVYIYIYIYHNAYIVLKCHDRALFSPKLDWSALSTNARARRNDNVADTPVLYIYIYTRGPIVGRRSRTKHAGYAFCFLTTVSVFAHITVDTFVLFLSLFLFTFKSTPDQSRRDVIIIHCVSRFRSKLNT